MLSSPSPALHSVTRIWMRLAIFSLACAGLFALPPVVLRGSYFSALLPIHLIFDTALVIHVTLSITVWMLAMGCVLCVWHGAERFASFYRSAAWLCCLGAGLIIASPFLSFPQPLKSNYVPVLLNLPFFLGLACFSCGVLVTAGLTVLSFFTRSSLAPVGHSMAAFSGCIFSAALAFIFSYRALPTGIVPGSLDYYELLFWGGGHALQFAYTTLLMVAWYFLLRRALGASGFDDRVMIFLCWLNCALIACALPFLFFPQDALEETSLRFTHHMRIFGGIAPGILWLYLAWRILSTRRSLDSLAVLFLTFSMLLFATGGMMGFLISGSNVTIPAHYHGSTVAITLALMGICVSFFPALRFFALRTRALTVQVWLYALGQWMHVIGLFWMGGYGALRKDAGSSASIDTIGGKILFFTGGSLALLGGLLFVVLALRALLGNTHSSEES